MHWFILTVITEWYKKGVNYQLSAKGVYKSKLKICVLF